MDSHEHRQRPQWNAEVAVLLFEEFARMATIEWDICCVCYVRTGQEEMQRLPEDAAAIRRAIYAEAPLFVLAEMVDEDMDDRRFGLYLCKVNPMRGEIELTHSFLPVGYAFDEETENIVRFLLRAVHTFHYIRRGCCMNSLKSRTSMAWNLFQECNKNTALFL